MMNFIKELADKYVASFNVYPVHGGGYRLFVAGLCMGLFEDFDGIRAWCVENLKKRG